MPKISIQDRIIPAPQVLEASDEAGVKEILKGIMKEAPWAPLFEWDVPVSPISKGNVEEVVSLGPHG